MKFEIEITADFKEAIEKVIHAALLHGGATLLKDVTILTTTLSNLKEIENGIN